MNENFLPIPSLNNLYEINPRGEVRNAKSTRRKDAYAKEIPVSVEKNGEKYYFQSYSECARFFKKVEHYELPTMKKYLGQLIAGVFPKKMKFSQRSTLQGRRKYFGGDFRRRIGYWLLFRILDGRFESCGRRKNNCRKIFQGDRFHFLSRKTNS